MRTVFKLLILILIFVLFAVFIVPVRTVNSIMYEGYSGSSSSGSSSSSSSGGESCFPAGTPVVLSDGTNQNIEKIKVGDQVLSQDEHGRKSVSSVVGLETPVRDNLCTLTYNDGDRVELTDEHPVYTREGWKSINPAGMKREDPNFSVTDLTTNDEVMKSDGTFADVSSITCRSQSIQTYNLILGNGTHTYFAGGILVHNKVTASCFPPGTPVVMANGTNQNIEDVKIGDTVVSRDESGTMSVSKVEGLQQPVRDNLCRIDYTDGESLRLTVDHPVYTTDGWKSINPKMSAIEAPGLPITDLRMGDKMIKIDGTLATISAISCQSQEIKTYNLILGAGAHSYFAGGFMVHNITCGADEPPPPPPPKPGDTGTKDGKPATYYSDGKGGTVLVVDGTKVVYEGNNGTVCYIAGGGECGGGGGGGDGGGVPANVQPVIAGTIQARARELADTDTYSCSNVYGSSKYINTRFLLTPDYPNNAQTVTGGDYALWDVLPGTKTLSATGPANYIIRAACWNKDPGGSGTGLSASVESEQTLSWDLGYTDGTAWPQVSGGDVYATQNVISYVPTSAIPARAFLLDGTGGTPGIVTYGSQYKFDGSTFTSGGEAYVSTTNWLANDAYPKTDYYQIMYRRFGTPTTVDYPASSVITQPESKTTPYYAVGDVSTSGDWLIPSGQSLIFLVNGNLTIGGKIQTSGTGFVTFIVNGNITVSPTVGDAYNSSTPAIQGVYITSPSGIFDTGQSTVAGAERFVGKGIFVAGDFTNRRNLKNVGGVNYNNLYSSELFIYDPQLLITMPDAMKDTNIAWQEVAP